MRRALNRHEKKQPDKGSSLDGRLLAYCAMAGGALLAAQPADAAIVYSGVKNLDTDNGTAHALKLDLNGDGVTDFVFKSGTYITSHYFFSNLPVVKFSYQINYGKFFRNAPQNYLASIDGIKLRSSAAIPGDVKTWNNPADNSIGSLLNGYLFKRQNFDNITDASPPIWFPPKYDYAGSFDNSTGYLGVSFRIDDNTHYGWIQYKGRDYDNNTHRTYEGTVIDWAYEDVPFTSLSAGQKPCIDNDGDGYGQGEGCLGTDCNDDNASIYDNCTAPPPPPEEPCEVALTPGTISKFFSRVFPFAAIAIRGLDNATITRQSDIDWGTDGVKTLFVLPGGKNTIRAFVRIKPLLLEPGATYDVTVGECVGQLSVR